MRYKYSLVMPLDYSFRRLFKTVYYIIIQESECVRCVNVCDIQSIELESVGSLSLNDCANRSSLRRKNLFEEL